MDGLGGTIERVLTGISDYLKGEQNIELAKYQSQQSTLSGYYASVIETAKANSKTLLYLGIGVVGAAFLFTLLKRASRG